MHRVLMNNHKTNIQMPIEKHPSLAFLPYSIPDKIQIISKMA